MSKSPAHTWPYYLVNAITGYRIVTVPLLLWLLFTGRYDLFRWGIALSFFTDFIDGFLARAFRVTSVAGTRLDSVGDDLTIAVALTGLIVQFPDFIRTHLWMLMLLAILFLLQTGYAFFRYKKMSSFHTWLAKTAAILQGVFLILTFFTGQPDTTLFYTATFVTAIELVEEIILVYLLPQWRINVHSIFHVLRENKKTAS